MGVTDPTAPATTHPRKIPLLACRIVPTVQPDALCVPCLWLGISFIYLFSLVDGLFFFSISKDSKVV